VADYDNTNRYLGKKFPKRWTAEQRFFASWAQDENGCWNWLGSLSPRGYGRIKVGDKNYRSHRYSWATENGRQIPDGMVVCHACDNPKCVNPTHLFIGTMADNVADCVRKGRHARGERLAHPRARGEKNGNSRLTEQQVNRIKSDGRPQRVIAAEFGVSQTAIWAIKNGRMWA